MRSTPSARRRSLPARLGALALGMLFPAAALATVTATPAYADDGESIGRSGQGLLEDTISITRGPLTGLGADDGPTDGGSGKAVIIRGVVASVATLRLSGLDPAVAGQTFGVHIHTGPCVEGDGEAAGPHYNHDRDTDREPVRVSPRTEVWLDVTVNKHGRGHASAVVPFAIPSAGDGVASIVVHEKPTDSEGMAGGRLACLPLEAAG